MTSAIRMAAAGCVLTILSQTAEATLDVATYRSINGAESGGAANITHEREITVGGDGVYAVTYDFVANGGAQPMLVLPVYARPPGPALTDTPRGVLGTRVRFRLRAPLVSKITVHVFDTNGNDLTPGMGGVDINRQGLLIDNQGWAVVTLPELSTAKVIGQVDVRVSRPDPAAEQGALAATLYVRDLQVLNGANPAPYPSKTVQVKGASAWHGTLSSVPPMNTQASDSVQKITYDFGPLNSQYGAAVMDLAAPIEATYARFRVQAPEGGVRLRLNLIDTNGGSYQYDIDRTKEVIDESGWATHTVRLDRYSLNQNSGSYDVVGKAFKSVHLQVRKLTNVPGTALFKEVDLLTSAPSAAAPLEVRLTQFTDQASTGATVRTLPYDFSLVTNPQALHSAVYLALEPASPVQANRLTFQAKVPQGVAIRAQFQDNNAKWFDTDVLKPLATVDDAGWVQYAVNLERGLQVDPIVLPIKKIALVVRRNTNVAINSQGATPAGQVNFRQIWLGLEADQLDLSSATPTVTTLKRMGSDPLPSKLGVVSRKPEEADDKVQDLINATGGSGTKFKYARLTMGWNDIAPANGLPPFTFGGKDLAVKAIVSKGMMPILILAYNHRFHGTEKKGIPSSATANQDAYLQYVSEVVKHYSHPSTGLAETKGKPLVYEIWNEPNAAAFWGPTPNAADYAQLMLLAAKKVKDTCGSCEVVSAGLARIDFPFLKGLKTALTSSANSAYVDAIGLHPYTPYPDVQPESQVDELLAARAYLAPIVKPLWTTELGYSSSIGDTIDPAASNTTGKAIAVDGRTAVARTKQARRMVRELLSSIAFDSPMHIIYNMRDWYGDYGTYSPTNQEHNFGLYEATVTDESAQQGRIKPAGTALARLITSIGSLKYHGLVTGFPTNVQAMKFGKAVGDPATGIDNVYVAWMNGPGRKAAITVAPNCAANSSGSTANWGNCITNMLGGIPTNACRPAEANGRVVCTLTEVDGPLIVRTGSR